MANRAIAASMIGTTVEWYDFFLYGTASALIFSKFFFPTFSPLAGTIASFGTFAAGFLARPIGGIVFGYFGDKVGRKSMLIWSLIGMGVATAAIGCLPTYDAIGVWAPALLVLCRLVQGFAVGGEWGGAVLISVEHTPENKRGLAGSWTQAGSPAGLVLATAAFGAAEAISGDGFAAWGWRLPFLLSLVLVIVGLIVRLKIVESPEFKQVKETGAEAKVPLYEVIRHHPLNILLAIGCCLAPFVNFYLFATFVLTYGTTTLGLDSTPVLVIVSIVALIEVGTIPLVASLSDRYGRGRIFLIGAVLFAAFAFPFFIVTQAAPSAIVLGIASFVGLSLVHPFMYGPMAALFAELFPPEVRYSGASLGYQIGAILGGGFAPLILTALLSTGIGATGAIPPYMIVVSALTFLCVFYAGKRRGVWGNRNTEPVADATGIKKEEEIFG